MNRKILFRAWDKDMSEMLEVHGIQFTEHSPMPNPCIIDQHNDSRDLVDVELMQFTGLHDKNGKEIFESDVVYAHANVTHYVVKFGEHRDESEHRQCGFFVERLTGYKGYKEAVGVAEMYLDVIGNIHENPELLTEAK
jgi:uncharacterized phage protein (TIGR01671 family)